MADTKLSALTELNATPAGTDELYIRDVSESASDESKRITVTNLVAAASGPTEASQGNMEDEDTGTLYAPPDLIKHSPGVAKAWGRITDAGANEAPIYGLDATTDTGTGDRTINFSTAFSTAVYAALATTTRGSVAHNLFDTFATDSVRLRIYDSTPSIADYSHAVAFFGDH